MKRSRRINSNRALRLRENTSSACRLSNTELRMDMSRCQMIQEQTTMGTLGEFSRIIEQPKMVHRVSNAKMSAKNIRTGRMRRTIRNWTDYYTRIKSDSIVIEKGRGVRCSRMFAGWRQGTSAISTHIGKCTMHVTNMSGQILITYCMTAVRALYFRELPGTISGATVRIKTPFKRDVGHKARATMTDTYHSLCLKDIRMQSNTSKQIQKNLKILLHYLLGKAGDTTIIRVEFANGISAKIWRCH